MSQHIARAGQGKKAFPLGPPGVVLVLTILLVGLFLVMGTTLINLASSDYQVANNESRSVQALFNAEAGIEEAKMRLSPTAPTASKITVGTSADWRVYILSGHTQAEVQGGLDSTYGKAAPAYAATESTSNYTLLNTVQTGSNTIPWGWLRIQHKIDTSGNIIYQDALTGAQVPSASQVVGASTVYNPPVLVVTAEGIKDTIRRMISIELQPIVSTTTTTNTIVTDPFNDAAHGRGNGVSSGTPVVNLIGNAWTDSYNSNNGAYGGTNIGLHGDISTDAVAANSVNILAGATVGGTVLIGPAALGGDTSTAISNSGSITGTPQMGREPSTWNIPDSTIPGGLTMLPALNSEHDVTLSEGTYWYPSIRIAGTARLIVTGRVKIYVTGSIDFGGNGIVSGSGGALAPPNLLIYGTVNPNDATQKCTSVSIHGNGAFYGAIYAPEAAASVSGNGAVFGALTANTVTINGNGGFHYDEALGNLGETVTTSSSTSATTTGYTRYSWREIAF